MNIKSKRCIIIAGAPDVSIPIINSTDFIIAVDYGYEHALKHNITPDLIIGDFDSYKGILPTNIPIISAPQQKNDTDTLLAVKTALSRGFRDFQLLGVLGGRIDHQTANFAVAAFIAESGANCAMISDDTICYTIKNSSIDVKKHDGFSLSVFSHTDKSVGVNIKNVQYPLCDFTVTNLFPIGVSNSFLSDSAIISVKEGILHIILSKM